MLPSRLCTSIIFSFQGLSKSVIILNLVMCKASHDFIITQEGLKGFLNRVHDNFKSLFYELKVSKDFARKVGIFANEKEIEGLTVDSLKEQNQIIILRHYYPAMFVASLKAMERNYDLKALHSENNERDYTWTIFGTLIPDLQRDLVDGRLHTVKDLEMI